MKDKRIIIDVAQQTLCCLENERIVKYYNVSTATNGLGEQQNSGCTPRGKHRIYDIIGLDAQPNSVFVGRQWTGEIYSLELAIKNPGRDWILTRILQLDGLEPGNNKNGPVDSLSRYIYIHGVPDGIKMGVPGSHGCIRMLQSNIIELALWVHVDMLVEITKVDWSKNDS